MRIELQFELEKAELPKDNKSIWISFLKNVISVCNNGKFYDRYFSEVSQKDYTFSILLAKPKFVEEKVFLENNQVKMIFSADDRRKTGLIFYAAFIQAKRRRFSLPEGNGMMLNQVRQLGERLITGSKVVFRTVTGGGLVVREHNSETNQDKYYTFQDEGFEEKLKIVLRTQAEGAGFSGELAERIKVTPIQCRKVLVKFYGRYVDTTVGIFQLEGDTDLLQYFYQAGIGSRHSAGFGLMDIVTQEDV
ncbi:CRISPR-associated endoribonuclease Cas6 [Roseburia hominis]